MNRYRLTCVLRVTLCALVCAIVVNSPSPVSAQLFARKPTSCPLVFNPVCGRKGNDLVNYGNACVAAANGAKILAQGPCPQGCPMIYKPVCAEDAQGVRRNYGNACAAEKDGAKIIRNRRCFVTFGRH